MTFATVAAVIGAAAGAKSLLGGSGGGGSSGGSSNTYVPTGAPQADAQFQQMLQQLVQGITAQGGQLTPELQQAFQKMLGIDTSGLTAGADRAGKMYGDLAGTAQGASQNLLGQAGVNQTAQQNLMKTGDTVANTAMDPMNALRNQIQQQTVDASRAGTSARGIGMGAESAGIENKAVQDMMMQWQQMMLQRQVAGAGAQAGSYDAADRQGAQAGQNTTAGLAAGEAAPSFAAASGSVPYNASTTAATLPFTAANLYSSGLNTGVNQPTGAGLSSIIPYLYAGQGATNQLFGQQQTGLNNLTTGLGQLGNSPWLKNFFAGNGGNLQDPGGGSQGDAWAQGGFGT